MKKSKCHVKHNKKSRKVKTYFFFLLFIISIYLTISFSKNYTLTTSNKNFLRNIIAESNHHISYKKDTKKIVTSIVKFFSFVNLDEPTSILKQNYSGLVNNIDTDEVLGIDKIEELSDYVEDSYPEHKQSEPVVYIYNTHQLEEYSTQNTESYSVTPNVMMASYILREKLRNYNISSLVEENNVTELLKANAWNYASSYKITKLLMTDAKEKNPTLNYYIDIHRDSIPKKLSTVTINDKSYAKMMLLVGLENPNYQLNLDLATRFDSLLKEKYPGISRGIYKKEGPGVNGIYNQNFSPNTMLIEVGGSYNSIEEVLNSVEVIASILNILIGGTNGK